LVFGLKHGKLEQVKQYTTRFYKAIALFFLSAPILQVLIAAVFFDIPLHLCVSILLSPFYYVVTFIAVIAGYGLWETQRWSWYCFVLAQALIIYENAVFVSNYGESHHKVFAFIFYLLVQALFFVRVGEEIRVPYFFPKIRWWESNPRLKLSVPATLVRASGLEISGSILDLSVMGCFLKTKDELQLNEKVTLKSNLYGQDLSCTGSIVWCAQTSVTHPHGVGIKFDLLPKPQRRVLRLITHRLKRISAFYRRSRYLMSQDEFIAELDRLEKHKLEDSSQFTPWKRGKKGNSS
jgi:uncharacterized membrane protein (DUF2068 family)